MIFIGVVLLRTNLVQSDGKLFFLLYYHLAQIVFWAPLMALSHSVTVPLFLPIHSLSVIFLLSLLYIQFQSMLPPLF